ncbi:MAG: hypothetical protein LIO51_01360 [Clostridiales bacterium]|nr:hypothetical protein [Clostridiales bacterium]
MIDQFLSKKRNLYLMVAFVIFIESLSTALLKVAGQYPTLSFEFCLFYVISVGIFGVDAICWQLMLERMPLGTAYMRKGGTYVLFFFWAVVLFHETITVQNIIGMGIIILGMVVSMSDDH